MSASTVPASIDSSWNGSPTITIVASSRSAASSRAASGNDTIDISSTITISWGRRFVRSRRKRLRPQVHPNRRWMVWGLTCSTVEATRSEEHTSELQSRENLVCRLLLEKKKKEKEYT